MRLRVSILKPRLSQGRLKFHRRIASILRIERRGKQQLRLARVEAAALRRSPLPSRLDESRRRPPSPRAVVLHRTLKAGKLVAEASLDSKPDEPFDLRSDEITR